MSIESVKKYIAINLVGASSSGKTNIYEVRNIDPRHDVPLGSICWHGAWRKYVYECPSNTLYDWDCLRYIADFCETATKEHKS